jgi:hypothetical protein
MNVKIIQNIAGKQGRKINGVQQNKKINKKTTKNRR